MVLFKIVLIVTIDYVVRVRYIRSDFSLVGLKNVQF